MKKIIRITQEEIFPQFSGQVFSYGNKKLPESTMIVNLTSAQNCPAKQLGLCLVPDVCYAQKGEELSLFAMQIEDQDILNEIDSQLSGVCEGEFKQTERRG